MWAHKKVQTSWLSGKDAQIILPWSVSEEEQVKKEQNSAALTCSSLGRAVGPVWLCCSELFTAHRVCASLQDTTTFSWLEGGWLHVNVVGIVKHLCRERGKSLLKPQRDLQIAALPLPFLSTYCTKPWKQGKTWKETLSTLNLIRWLGTKTKEK